MIEWGMRHGVAFPFSFGDWRIDMKKIMIVVGLSLGFLGLVSATVEKPAKAGYCGMAPYCSYGSNAVCVCDYSNCIWVCVRER